MAEGRAGAGVDYLRRMLDVVGNVWDGNESWIILLAMGLLCALGNICVFIALRYTTAATVSQYHYTQLVAGAVVAYLMFHEKPTRSMLVGAILIVGSGLYIAALAARADYGKAVETQSKMAR